MATTARKSRTSLPSEDRSGWRYWINGIEVSEAQFELADREHTAWVAEQAEKQKQLAAELTKDTKRKRKSSTS